MSQAELNGELFTLERFPPNAEEEALQAWEAADEYLLQQVNDVDGLTLIFNDGFGALACALAERNPVSINDSFISELATRHNLRMNGIDEESVRFRSSNRILGAFGNDSRASTGGLDRSSSGSTLRKFAPISFSAAGKSRPVVCMNHHSPRCEPHWLQIAAPRPFMVTSCFDSPHRNRSFPPHSGQGWCLPLNARLFQY
ncbi:methyltransferase [Klebsiella phage vB_KleS-HSE3]|nr:methyltransferase [Klebsiella phage vB_KleS-HSE3]